MAKSLRASRTKANKTRLRKTIFEKVEQERNDRLSSKLIEIAKAPKPSRSKDVDMDVLAKDDPKNAKAKDDELANEDDHAMAIDKPNSSKRVSAKGNQSRIGKRRKTSKGVVFPIGKKHGPSRAQGRKRKV